MSAPVVFKAQLVLPSFPPRSGPIKLDPGLERLSKAHQSHENFERVGDVLASKLQLLLDRSVLSNYGVELSGPLVGSPRSGGPIQWITGATLYARTDAAHATAALDALKGISELTKISSFKGSSPV